MNPAIIKEHSAPILVGAKSFGLDDQQLIEITSMSRRDLAAVQKGRAALTVPQARAIEAHLRQSVGRLAVIGIGVKSPLLDETLELIDLFDSIRDDLPAYHRKSVAGAKPRANSIAFRKSRTTARAK